VNLVRAFLRRLPRFRRSELHRSVFIREIRVNPFLGCFGIAIPSAFQRFRFSLVAAF
jgi:hypothetical protein